MKHKRKEFAALCGLTPGNLSNYIKAGKVVIVNGLIDDKTEQNAYFLSRRQQQPPNKGVAKPPRKNAMTIKQPNKLDVDKAKEQIASYKLDQEKKAADIALRNQQAKLMQLKQGKILGEYIPTDMVRLLFNQHFRSLSLTLKDGIDQFITRIAQKAKMGQNDIAELRKSMIEMLNKSIDRANMITDREIETQASSDKPDKKHAA